MRLFSFRSRSSNSARKATSRAGVTGYKRSLKAEQLESRDMLTAVIATVNTTIDETTNPATTSLREAIIAVNANTDTTVVNSIRFSGSALNGTLSVDSALPVITDLVSIEADQFAPLSDYVTITRSGSWSGPNAAALQFNIATGSSGLSMTIEGLKINGFTGAGSHAISVTNLPAQTSLTIKEGTFDNNGGNGIHINLPTSKNYGTLNIDNNVISRNQVGISLSNFVQFSPGTFTITNNKVGTDAVGTSTTRGNLSHGIYLFNVNSSSIQASNGIKFNTVVNNDGDGFRIENSVLTNSYIESNRVGLNTADAALGNDGDGIHLKQSRTTILNNDIGANGGDGIDLENSQYAIIQGNGIGTKRTSTSLDRGNVGAGIALTTPIAETRDITIVGNSISFNNGSGVSVSSVLGDRNEISQNNFRDNGGIPIDLLGLVGQDPQDGNDTDTGPNDLMNYPVLLISSASLAGGNWTIPLSYDVDRAGDYRFEIYKYTEGNPVERRYTYVTSFTKSGVTVGAVDYQSNIVIPNGSAAGNVQAGDRLAALAVRTLAPPDHVNLKNTSEISPPTTALTIADVTPPRVTNVLISGVQSVAGSPAWAANTVRNFSNLIAAGDQLRPIATQGTNQIRIQFSEEVRKRNPSGQYVAIGASDLFLYRTVRQQAAGTNPAVTPYTTTISLQIEVATSYYYDLPTQTGVWTFPTLSDGKYAIHLASDSASSGIYGVTDVAGNALDSSWMSKANQNNGTADYWQDDPSMTFADGDGAAGSEDNRFRFHFAILVGDYDGNGVVNSNDATIVGDYATDGDGNGVIDAPSTGNDNTVRNSRLYNVLPLKGIGGADFTGSDDDYVSTADLVIWKTANGINSNGDATGNSVTDGDDFLKWQNAFVNRSVWNLDGPEPNFVTPGSDPEPSVGLPKVANVLVRGTASQHTTFSFDSVDGSGAQLKAIPVGSPDTIYIVFTEGVNVSADDLMLVGLRTASIPALAEFRYDSLSFTASWKFTGWTQIDQYLIALSDVVTDYEGNQLDGEWTNPATIATTNALVSEFPSGDGAAGGWFKFAITLLPGDANLDGVVYMPDYTLLAANWGPSTLNRTFSQGDFNGDGAVNEADQDIMFGNWQVNFQSLSLLADFDGDFDVDEADMSVIYQYMGTTGATHATGDLNGDGSVTLADYDLAYSQYGLAFNAVT